MFRKNLLFILSGLVAVLTLSSCGKDDPVDTGDDRAKVTVTDTLQGSSGTNTDVTVAPATGNTIYLKGYYIVNRSSTLTIPAGTKVIGLPESVGGQPAALITESGDADNASGKLMAEGTATSPIIFTSSLAAGSRDRGNWGGVVLLGNAENNLASLVGTIEGTGGNYGPVGTPKNDDNSGTLRYVRIEYGGTKVSLDNEINGLTMGSVGSGTTLEYIQSHMIADDGFEWFGGTVNGKYLVSSGNDDDGFDMDFGYHGNLQFLFVMQDPDLANRGFEIDNDGDGSANTPLTGATVANVTIVGAGKPKANSENNDGFYLRRNNQLNIWNAISTNFQWAMVIDGSSTHQQVAGDKLFVKQSILNGMKGAYGYGSKDTAGVNVADYSVKAGSSWNNILEDPQLVGIDFANPQPRPQNPKASNVGSVPNNSFFSANTYAGAFDPSNSTYWFSGWTNWAKK